MYCRHLAAEGGPDRLHHHNYKGKSLTCSTMFQSVKISKSLMLNFMFTDPFGSFRRNYFFLLINNNFMLTVCQVEDECSLQKFQGSLNKRVNYIQCSGKSPCLDFVQG